MTTSLENPLLDLSHLPRFKDIRPEHVLPAVEKAIADAKAHIEKLLIINNPNFDSFVTPLAEEREVISKVWGPVSHLNAVVDTPELRAAHEEALPKISDFQTGLRQDERIYQIFKKIRSSAEYEKLNGARKKIIEETLREFRLGGAELAPTEKKRFAEIMAELSLLSSKFSNHVLDETKAFELLLSDKKDLAGLPETLIQGAHRRAVADGKGKEGDSIWKFTLDMPSYLPFMKYSKVRALREKMYLAYGTRATQGENNNSPVLDQILALRQEMASLLGYKNYAEVSLATKMAKDPTEVIDFLTSLVTRSQTVAKKELEELKVLAKELDQLSDLKVWDVAHYSEILQEKKLNFNDETLKPYFPEDKAIEGLFKTVEKLFGFSFKEEVATLWHPDAKQVAMYDERDHFRGQLFIDLYARTGKRGGAWMDICHDYKSVGGKTQFPVAYLNCNFTPAEPGKKSLLTHDEVVTLFHEMGHVLHLLSSQVPDLDASGLNGVPWDGVELPSQFMENWCYEAEGLALISSHFETGATLPTALVKQIKRSREFQAALMMIRQMEFSIVDMKIHTFWNRDLKIHDYIRSERQKIGVLIAPPETKMENSFTHIFGGGYAAGYYSYKWAEVLSADAFSLFEETGIFNEKTGRKFLNEILSKGGSEDFMKLYENFRGRQPTIDALLRHSGIA